MIRQHHIFIAAPASGGLNAQMARSLACAPRALAVAGYGPAVMGAHPKGQIHIDGRLIGDSAAGLFHFFARTRERAARFASALGGPVGRIVLNLPCYDSYYPMLWRELAAIRALRPFEGAVPRLLARERRWVQVVEDLKAALNPREIIVLPTPATIEDALAALVPGAEIAPQPVTLLQQSDSAIAMMQRLHRAGISIGPKQMQRLAGFHDRQPQGTPIAQFGSLAGTRLRRAYQADLAQLAAMEGVRIGAEPAYHQVAAQ